VPSPPATISMSSGPASPQRARLHRCARGAFDRAGVLGDDLKHIGALAIARRDLEGCDRTGGVEDLKVGKHQHGDAVRHRCLETRETCHLRQSGRASKPGVRQQELPMNPPFRIVEAIYPGMTQLDFTAPHTVFSRLPGVEVVVASAEGGEVRADGGLTFAGVRRLAEIDACDLLFAPGGRNATVVINDRAFMDAFDRLAAGARYLTSVCTGSLILAATGRLRGRRAACHWAWRDLLTLFGAIPDSGRVVRDGDIFTGAGVTAGLDFALTVAAELAGPALAQGVQLALDYAPSPPFDAGRPETAPPEVLETTLRAMQAGSAERRADALRAAQRLTAA